MSSFTSKTRDGRPAQFWRADGLPFPFLFEGRIEDRDLEMWKGDGSWREDGSEHPKDLVDVPGVALVAAAARSYSEQETA